MNPAMLPRKTLRLAKAPRELAPAWIALVALVAVVAGVGLVQARVGRTPPVAPVTLTPPSATIPGTTVPLPPASFHLEARTGKMPAGRHIYRPIGGKLSRPSSIQLFAFYLTNMHDEGWTLIGKADPSAIGEWTLSWAAGSRSATVYLYTRPTTRFTVDVCPPMRYC